MVTTSIPPERFFKIYRNWLTRLALARSGGGSRSSVVIIYTYFPTIGGEESHKILVLGEDFLQDL